MRRRRPLRIVGALLAALVVGGAVAQTPPQTPPSKAPVDVVLEPAAVNLHMLEPNEVRKIEFLVKNVSDQPIKIDTVLTSCRCVSVDFDAHEIPPGGSGVAHVTVTAATAEARKSIATVRTSGVRRTVTQFTIEYAVIPEVFTQPRKADFGRARVGDKGEIELKVVVHLPRELAVDPVLEPYVAQDLPVKVALDPQVVTKIREDTRDLTTTLRLKLDTSRPLAAFDSNVVFKPKGPGTYRLTLVRLLGEVRGAAWFEHAQLAFGPVAVGATTVFEIRLYGDGPDAPKLEEVSLAPAVFTEKHEVEAEKHCVRFDLSCTPTATGPIAGELRVKYAGCAQPLALPITARGK
jgi:hypothetical protein